jgi:hypothetical protein
MLSDTITQDELDILTDAFLEKARMSGGLRPKTSERFREIIQMVIVDTMLTVEGVVTVEQWGAELMACSHPQTS